MKRLTSFLLLSALLMVACISYGTDAGPPPQKPDIPSWQTSASIEKSKIDVSVKMSSHAVQQDINVSDECMIPAVKITYKKYRVCADKDIGSYSLPGQPTCKNFKPKLSNTEDFSGYSMIN